MQYFGYNGSVNGTMEMTVNIGENGPVAENIVNQNGRPIKWKKSVCNRPSLGQEYKWIDEYWAFPDSRVLTEHLNCFSFS